MHIRFYAIPLQFSYNNSSPYLIKILEESPEIARGMVFCYQNCSDLLWEKIALEKLEFAKFWDH